MLTEICYMDLTDLQGRDFLLSVELKNLERKWIDKCSSHEIPLFNNTCHYEVLSTGKFT